MLLYFDYDGKLKAQIQHGYPPRQGSDLPITICLPLDFWAYHGKEKNQYVKTIEFRVGKDGLTQAYDLQDSESVYTFHKSNQCEQTYNFVDGEEYLSYSYEANGDSPIVANAGEIFTIIKFQKVVDNVPVDTLVNGIVSIFLERTYENTKQRVSGEILIKYNDIVNRINEVEGIIPKNIKDQEYVNGALKQYNVFDETGAFTNSVNNIEYEIGAFGECSFEQGCKNHTGEYAKRSFVGGTQSVVLAPYSFNYSNNGLIWFTNDKDNATNSAILGGTKNQILDGRNSAIVGGVDNAIKYATESFATGTENKIGDDTHKNIVNAFVIGYKNETYASHTFVANAYNDVFAVYSSAFGHHNIIYNEAIASIVGGWYSEIHSSYSFAFGFYLDVNKSGQFAVGSYNAQDDDAMFVVGVGNSDTNRKNGFAVKTDGSAEVLTQGDTDKSVVIKETLDTEIGDIDTRINSLSANKVDKLIPDTGFDKAYIVTKDGQQSGIRISDTQEPESLVKRDEDGKIYTATPTKNTDVANKGYVDNKIAALPTGSIVTTNGVQQSTWETNTKVSKLTPDDDELRVYKVGETNGVQDSIVANVEEEPNTIPVRQNNGNIMVGLTPYSNNDAVSLSFLNQKIDEIKNQPDIVDIVETYADLEDYNVFYLGLNDIIRVLQDETQEGGSTYYKLISKTIDPDREEFATGEWEFIGQAGDYYTKTQADNKFVKQETKTGYRVYVHTPTGDDTVNYAQSAISGDIPQRTTNGNIIGPEASKITDDSWYVTKEFVDNKLLLITSTETQVGGIDGVYCPNLTVAQLQQIFPAYNSGKKVRITTFSDARRYYDVITANEEYCMIISQEGWLVEYYNFGGIYIVPHTTIVGKDLSSSGFTPSANTYYKHIGNTTTNFKNGVIYFYSNGTFKAIDGSGSGGGYTKEEADGRFVAKVSTEDKSATARLYAIKNDGSQYIQWIFGSNGTTEIGEHISYSHTPCYALGHLSTRTPKNDYHCANKKYVDENGGAELEYWE